MAFKSLVPVNTTVRLRDGKVGRIVGHDVIVDGTGLPVAVNLVHVEHDKGIDMIMCDGADLNEQPYDRLIWEKHCWTPPK